MNVRIDLSLAQAELLHRIVAESGAAGRTFDALLIRLRRGAEQAKWSQDHFAPERPPCGVKSRGGALTCDLTKHTVTTYEINGRQGSFTQHSGLAKDGSRRFWSVPGAYS